MRVVLPGGEVVDLGITGATPTIGITDYSRRVTDDFGVTTVVERGFARRMSVRMAVPFDGVDALQQRLADLRATSALWVADDRFASLSVQGFYKDFSIDLAVPPVSYCTLEVEGLAASEPVVDTGGNPAPVGQSSTLQLIQPVTVTTASLIASNVPENDAPEWASTTSYPLGARVIKAATHRVYESLSAVNNGNDPAGTSGKWLDLGPTSRWAMFDQALGTSTSRAGSVAVTLDAGAAGAVALLDVVGATARVQAPGYDRTVAIGAGAVTFLDLPAVNGQVTVTITGPGDVSVGTLLIGRLVPLGITEASPTAGITDYSRKDVDEFGEVTIVQRAYSKKMSVKALIRTDALDVVANRIAAVRARPSLWIGQAGLDSLTIYGLFKDFSIEVGESVSKLSLSIDGMSKAAKVTPIGGVSDWADLTDRTGTKPANNADRTSENVAKDTAAVGGKPSSEMLGDMATFISTMAQQIGRVDGFRDVLNTIGYVDGQPVNAGLLREILERKDDTSAVRSDLSLAFAKNANGTAAKLSSELLLADETQTLAQALTGLLADNGDNKAQVQLLLDAVVNPSGGAAAKFVLQADADGTLVGISGTTDGATSTLKFMADVFAFVDPNNGQPRYPFRYQDGILYLDNVVANKITISAVAETFQADQNLSATGGYQTIPGGLVMQWGRYRGQITDETSFSIIFPRPFPTMCFMFIPVAQIATASNERDLWLQNLGNPTPQGASVYAQAATRNDQKLDGFDWIALGR